VMSWWSRDLARRVNLSRAEIAVRDHGGHRKQRCLRADQMSRNAPSTVSATCWQCSAKAEQRDQGQASCGHQKLGSRPSLIAEATGDSIVCTRGQAPPTGRAPDRPTRAPDGALVSASRSIVDSVPVTVAGSFGLF
jgi:hypothetical protein